MSATEITLYKPRETVFVEAVQLSKNNVETVASWCNGRIVEEIDPRDDEKKYVAVNVPTPDGNQRLSEGQVLVHNGTSFSVVGPSEFFRRHQEA